VHHRVADEDRLDDLARLDPAFGGERGGELVQRRAHGLRHLHRAARVHHRVGDPAHQVLAEADLGFITPEEASTDPFLRSVRCAAMVVEPTSTASP
jgi:hypothetical protein